jgi:hypothetical protein
MGVTGMAKSRQSNLYTFKFNGGHRNGKKSKLDLKDNDQKKKIP